MEGGRYFRTGAYEKEKYFIEGMHLLCILIYLINVKKIWYKFEKIVNQNFFQVPLKKRSIRGKISNRPASMSKINTHLERQEKELKFPIGPTISRPGPILFNVAVTAVKFVIRSKLSREIIRTEAPKIRRYTLR